MPTVSTAITDLSGLRSLAYDKAARAESSRTDQQIQRSSIDAAEQRIEQAEASVTRSEMEKSKAQDKLSPPPTKTVAGDGKKGGSKTVVDEREKDKLQAQLRAADLQVNQAQNAVSAASAEAEEMKGNILQSVGLTEKQTADMQSLSSQISELEALAADEQVDLTGQEFQDKLKAAKELTESLADDVPDTANAALEDFWGEIGDGFSAVQNAMTIQLTPTPATVKKEDNYAGFFEDTEQGYDAILANLEANGESREVLNTVTASKNLILGNSDTYYGGMTDGDDASLSAMLTHVNTLIDKMGSEELTADDIATLLALGEETNGVLRSGGRGFENAVAIPFDTAGVNLDDIGQDLQGDSDFTQLYTRMTGLFNGGNDYSQLQGITADEIDQAYEFTNATTEIAEIIRDGGTPTDAQVAEMIEKGNALADNLENNYGFNSANGTGSSGNGSSGGGFRLPSRRRQGA